MKNIVAFDLGSKFAMATLIDGALHVEKITRNSDQLREHWLAQVMGYVNDLCQQLKPDLVFYERPFARGQAATRMGWGLAGVIEAVASSYNVPVLDMPPATIKKWAAGKGNATKEEMTATAQIMYGYAGEDEHEADAVCALYYAASNTETIAQEKLHGPDDGCDDSGEDESAGEAQRAHRNGGGGIGDQASDVAGSTTPRKSKKSDRRQSAGGRGGKAARGTRSSKSKSQRT